MWIVPHYGMTDHQRLFWSAVQALARVTREAPGQDKQAAADAWALEMEIQRRIDQDALQASQQVAEEPHTPPFDGR